MAEALTRKQIIQAVWNKFKAIIGNHDISGMGDGTVTGALAGLNGKIISGSRLIEFTNGVGWIPFDANSTQKEPVFTANLVRIEVQTTEWISAVNASEYKKGRLVVYLNTKSTLERYVQYVCILQD